MKVVFRNYVLGIWENAEEEGYFVSKSFVLSRTSISIPRIKRLN